MEDAKLHKKLVGQELYEEIDEEIYIEEEDEKNGAQTRQISVLVIGAGIRGNVYSQYALDFPARMKVVGVAEPVNVRRRAFQQKHQLPAESVFINWREAAALDRFADAVLITTLDDLHHDPLLEFARKKYHILCEKPLALTEKDCEEMVEEVQKNDVILCVGHVLRYTPEIKKLKMLISSGRIGKVVNIQYMEPIGWMHFAHSFVRGNWRKHAGDAGSLMAKSCHDIDIIKHIMGDERCVKIQSLGNLNHFTKSNKPKGSASRCMECDIEPSCPYSAIKAYIEPIKHGRSNGFCRAATEWQDIESMTDAIRTGPYGRCVYECDNDVCDNQTVCMEFENGTLATFTMSAFTEATCKRRIKVLGTRGEIALEQGRKNGFTLFDFTTLKKTSFVPTLPKEKTEMCGHGYADYFLMKAFVKAVSESDSSHILSTAEDSLRGHKIVFAAERSRINDGSTLKVSL